MGGDDPEVKQVSRLSPGQQRFLDTILIPLLTQGAQGIPSSLFPGFPTFNEQVPGLTGGQMTSLAGLERLAGEIGSGTGGGGGETLAEANRAIQQFLRGGGEFNQEGFEEFFRTGIQGPALRSFQEDVLPAISRGTAQSGFFGSARREADARAREDLLQGLTEQRGQLAFASEQAAQDRLLRAAGLAPELVGGEASTLLQTLIGANLGRDVLVQQFEGRRDEFNRQLNEVFRRLGLSSQVAGQPTQDVVGFQGEEGLGGDAITALAAILAAFIGA